MRGSVGPARDHGRRGRGDVVPDLFLHRFPRWRAGRRPDRHRADTARHHGAHGSAPPGPAQAVAARGATRRCGRPRGGLSDPVARRPAPRRVRRHVLASRRGVWMLDHHHVMRTDVFSYTVLGERWITPEWGYDVLLAQSVRSVGPVAFWLLSAGLATLTVVAVAIRSRVVGPDGPGRACCASRREPRSPSPRRPPPDGQLLLPRPAPAAARPGPAPAGVVGADPVLFVLWPICHGSFPLGLAILLLEVVAAGVRRGVGRVTVSTPFPEGRSW